MDFGWGGKKILVNTKYKSAEKPEWWDDDNNCEKYSHPTKAKLKVNEDVISSILKHYNYDVNTHCEIPPQKGKKSRGKKKPAGKILGESLLEDDPAIVELAVEKKLDDESGNVDEEVPIKWKKNTKSESCHQSPKSWFELNVIDKNVQERKEIEKAIGLSKIVEDLRKSDGIVDDINDNSSEESFQFDINDN